MRRLFTVFATACLLATGQTTFAQNGNGTKYGQEFTVNADDVMTVSSFNNNMKGKTELPNVVVQGKITQVCQAAGCWVKLYNDAGEEIMVKFKDHSFFVPKDIAGKTITVYGTGEKKVIPVKELRHLAKDAGASKDDIKKITAPKEEVRIIATGAIVQ